MMPWAERRIPPPRIPTERLSLIEPRLRSHQPETFATEVFLRHQPDWSAPVLPAHHTHVIISQPAPPSTYHIKRRFHDAVQFCHYSSIAASTMAHYTCAVPCGPRCYPDPDLAPMPPSIPSRHAESFEVSSSQPCGLFLDREVWGVAWGVVRESVSNRVICELASLLLAPNTNVGLQPSHF